MAEKRNVNFKDLLAFPDGPAYEAARLRSVERADADAREENRRRAKETWGKGLNLVTGAASFLYDHTLGRLFSPLRVVKERIKSVERWLGEAADDISERARRYEQRMYRKSMSADAYRDAEAGSPIMREQIADARKEFNSLNAEIVRFTACDRDQRHGLIDMPIAVPKELNLSDRDAVKQYAYQNALYYGARAFMAGDGSLEGLDRGTAQGRLVDDSLRTGLIACGGDMSFLRDDIVYAMMRGQAERMPGFETGGKPLTSDECAKRVTESLDKYLHERGLIEAGDPAMRPYDAKSNPAAVAFYNKAAKEAGNADKAVRPTNETPRGEKNDKPAEHANKQSQNNKGAEKFTGKQPQNNKGAEKSADKQPQNNKRGRSRRKSGSKKPRFNREGDKSEKFNPSGNDRRLANEPESDNDNNTPKETDLEK